MDFSVGAHLSLVSPDILGYHNTNRFEGNNMRESPFHGAVAVFPYILVADKEASENRGRGFV